MKDYKILWQELREYISKINDIDNSSLNFGKAVFGEILKVAHKTILKEMDKIENGFAVCDKCGGNIDVENSIYCQKCYDEQKEANKNNMFNSLFGE